MFINYVSFPSDTELIKRQTSSEVCKPMSVEFFFKGQFSLC
jgi:hypothetical protein